MSILKMLQTIYVNNGKKSRSFTDLKSYGSGLNSRTRNKIPAGGKDLNHLDVKEVSAVLI